MVGKLGPQYIAAVGLRNSFSGCAGSPASESLYGPRFFLVSYSFGKNDLDKCHSMVDSGNVSLSDDVDSFGSGLDLLRLFFIWSRSESLRPYQMTRGIF